MKTISKIEMLLLFPYYLFIQQLNYYLMVYKSRKVIQHLNLLIIIIMFLPQYRLKHIIYHHIL